MIRWHGALMAAAWALLLPLGMLLPKHRYQSAPYARMVMIITCLRPVSAPSSLISQ